MEHHLLVGANPVDVLSVASRKRAPRLSRPGAPGELDQISARFSSVASRNSLTAVFILPLFLPFFCTSG
jgi:hypothetical protein